MHFLHEWLNMGVKKCKFIPDGNMVPFKNKVQKMT